MLEETLRNIITQLELDLIRARAEHRSWEGLDLSGLAVDENQRQAFEIERARSAAAALLRVRRLELEIAALREELAKATSS